MAVRLSVVVINYERPDMTARCLTAVAAALGEAGVPGEVVVVDNGSRDGSVERLRRFVPRARVVALATNGPLPAALNRGLGAGSGEWVLMLNNDVMLEPGAIAEALAVAAGRPDVGCVALQMRFASRPDVINSAGIGVDRLGIPFDLGIGEPARLHPDDPREVFGACGGAALYRREMLARVGGFDESLGFGFEDVDLSWRARMRGWTTVLAPRAVALHAHGGTVAAGSSFRAYQGGLNRVRMLAKHAPGRLLARYGVAMVLYDVAYVAYSLVRERSLAPLAGRLRGLREWRAYRRAGRDGRRPVELAPVQGLRAALRRRAAWSLSSPTDAAAEVEGRA
jgi:GT2 family glycosyltransferase